MTHLKSERTEEEIAAIDIPEAVIEQPEDDSVSRIIADHIKPTLTGLVITGELVYDDWLKAAEFYQFLRSRTQWIVGDILRYGEGRYGEKYAQAVDEHGKSTSRLQTYVYVCNRFEIDRRRPELSFDHHAEAAGLDPREADRVLKEAITLRWSKQDVREEVAKINERNGVPKRGRKPGSTAAKVAASGKTPQVPDDEKPLIWNGYPLSTKDREVYQGPEKLPTEEADRAAHHHKLAHKEALVNWLEEHGFTKGGDEPCANLTENSNEVRKSLADSEPRNTTTSQPQSNGASVVQPDAAPQIAKASPTWAGETVYAKEGLLWVGDRWLNAIEADACANAHGFIYAEQMVKALESAQPAAPVAPPTPSETPAATVTPKSIADEILAIMATYHEQEERGEIDTPGGLEHMGDVWRLFLRWETALRKETSSADGALSAAPAIQKSPLETAEESILAFNAASAEVNEEEWKTIGENKLLRTKWLNRLLAQADIVIDKISGHPPTPRKA